MNSLTESIIANEAKGDMIWAVLSTDQKYIILLPIIPTGQIHGNGKPFMSEPNVFIKYPMKREMFNKLVDAIADHKNWPANSYDYGGVLNDILEKFMKTHSIWDIFDENGKIDAYGEFKSPALIKLAKNYIWPYYVNNVSSTILYSLDLNLGNPDREAFRKKFHEIADQPQKYDKSKTNYDMFELSANPTSLSHAVIDNVNKKIIVPDNTKQHNTRMNNYKAGQYVLPKNDFGISATELIKLVKDLVKSDKKYENYVVVDSYSHPVKEIPVLEFIAGKSDDEATKTKKNIDDRLRGNTFYAYHGTSLSIWKNEVSKNGLVPGKGPDYHDKIAGYSEKVIYLTHSLGDARKYAVRAGAGRGSAVLRVKITDPSKIDFDEDRLYDGVKHLPGDIKQEIKKRLARVFPDAKTPEGSWLFLEFNLKSGVSFEDNPLDFRGVRALFKLIKTQEQKNILAIIGTYASRTHASFAYRGTIRPSDIELYESFKSVKTGESDSEYNDKYDRVVNTIKKYTKESRFISFGQFLWESMQPQIITPTPAQWKECLNLFHEEFKHLMPNVRDYIDGSSSLKLCRAIQVDGKIVGAFAGSDRLMQMALKYESIEPTESYKNFTGKGIECVAIAIDEKYRRAGLSYKLIESAAVGFDYIWLLQFHQLKSIVDWGKKGYDIVGKNSEIAMYAKKF